MAEKALKKKTTSPAEAEAKMSPDLKEVARAAGVVKTALSKVTDKTLKSNLQEALGWLED